ncbi:hypothetical protein G7Y89_g14853 [Cudoniella acicularis]|uniref:Uncharacterized protein n=1 Tax=Cudoniella acicularis TaxID=354080 RepID=A0A8H4QY79_9HELO|nr:hypothetical protein G7Y89_g14853 [Cudoniella acicularis]
MEKPRVLGKSCVGNLRIAFRKSLIVTPNIATPNIATPNIATSLKSAIELNCDIKEVYFAGNHGDVGEVLLIFSYYVLQNGKWVPQQLPANLGRRRDIPDGAEIKGLLSPKYSKQIFIQHFFGTFFTHSPSK